MVRNNWQCKTRAYTTTVHAYLMRSGQSQCVDQNWYQLCWPWLEASMHVQYNKNLKPKGCTQKKQQHHLFVLS